MSIFNRVVFIEGEQAEEYKSRKTREAEDKKKADAERNDRRYNNHTVGDKKKNVYDDLDRGVKSGVKTIDMMMDRGIREPYKDSNFKSVEDSVNRHMRRHPKQYKEGTIFESIEII